MSYLQFLFLKVKAYSFSTLLRLEIESLLFGFCSLIPTTVGVFFRAIAAKILFKKMGGFAWIQPRCIIVHSDRIVVGSNFGVNSGSYINGVGGIEIGNFVLIGSNVTISSGVHPIDGFEPPYFFSCLHPQKNYY